mmetsp:Transcript_32565/g.71452  ORF Transcript_32565/g.71452 Transcript_32565/m.71452 type:complete len:293 (+) Transcript_32565:225-1103(+)
MHNAGTETRRGGGTVQAVASQGSPQSSVRRGREPPMYSVVPCGCTAIGGIPSCEVYIGLTSTVHAAAGPLLNISLCALSLAWGALPQSSQKVLPLLSPPLGGVLVVERLPLPKGQRDERVPEAAQLPPLQLCGARRRARFFQEVARPIHLHGNAAAVAREHHQVNRVALARALLEPRLETKGFQRLRDAPLHARWVGRRLDEAALRALEQRRRQRRPLSCSLLAPELPLVKLPQAALARKLALGAAARKARAAAEEVVGSVVGDGKGPREVGERAPVEAVQAARRFGGQRLK